MGLFTPKISSAQIQHVQLLLKQANESAKLVNTTVKPDVFFGRLNFLLDVLLEMQKYEKYKIFTGSLPSADYRKITGNLENTVNDFLNRAIANNKEKIASLKTDAARQKNYAKFVSDLKKSFLSSKTYWQGNTVYPHYNGPLYTSANYLRVQKLFDALFRE